MKIVNRSLVMNYIFTVILTVFASLVLAQGQRVAFEHYSAESFLSSALVRGMTQDKEGYLWFGTQSAVHRFDGFNFKTFKYETENKAIITKGYVNVIYEDRKGDIWIGSQGGLNKLNPRTGEFQQYFLDNPPAPLFKFDIQCVYEDSKGVLWIGSLMGLYNPDSSGTKLKSFVSEKYKELISNIAFRSIAEDGAGNVWFGSGIGLLKYEKQSNELIPIWIDPDISMSRKSWNTDNFAIQSICRDNSGILWAGSFGGTLLKVNTSTGQTTSFVLKDTTVPGNYPVQSICEEDEGKLWIATYNGLLLVDKNSSAILAHYVYDENNKESLSDGKLTSVLKDRSGALWIGTLTGGLNKLNRTEIPFRNLIRKTWVADRSYSQVPSSDMIISSNGSLLAGTANGIEEFKPGLKEYMLDEPNAAINVLMEDRNGNLWIAIKLYSGGGLYRKDPHGKLTSVQDSTGAIFSKEIQCLYETSNGRIFFASDFNLFEVDPVKNTVSFIFRTNRRIYRIGEDINNVLCLGTLAGGLYFFNPDSKSVIRHFIPDEKDANSISDNSISEIYLDSKNRLWIGTSSGLNKYIRETGGFKLYNDKSGLAHNLIYKILEDNSGNLWLGTGSGISKFNPELEAFKNYDASHGLVEGPHYIGGKSKSGEIFFKARTGISYFYPDSIKDNPFIPPVVITDVKVFNNPYPFSREIELSYSENYVSLEFAALSYVSPEKNMYAYKMDGVDKDWVNSGGRRYASYTSLEPGDYTFHVKGSNNDGVWNNEGAVLNIRILPPWYKTYWAYGLYFLSFVLLLYAWRKYELKRQNLKYQLQMEQENAERKEELSRMKSRFFTNISHEFRTPLTLIIGPADKIISSAPDSNCQKQAEIMKKNAVHLLDLVNQLLDISKMDEGKLKLRVSEGNLVSFVRGIVMIFESHAESKDIVMKVKAEREYIEGYFDKEKMEKVLINIISNAIKFTPNGGRILINISEEDNHKAVIRIKDNGIGIKRDELPKLFDRFYQVDSSHTREQGGTGIGLSLTKELIELHKGRVSVDSAEGEWTEFTIELSLGRENYKEFEISDDAEVTVTQFGDSGHSVLIDQIDAELENSAPPSQIPLQYRNDIGGNSANGGKPIILVVEDNQDVRQYISDALENDYIIEEAANGEQGFRKAEALIPDLIISDIMMPRMDGNEMTRKIRNDEKTFHIPIILLTAKSDQQSKFEGLESGADAYLIKPFDTNELRVRINNLIEIRKALQEKFARGERIPVREGEKKLSDLNVRFINKVIEVMEKHIAEEEFSIEDFSRELCMSRTQLHRKLKALTGKSASRYLRSYRLSRARKMIEEGKGIISEIAYNVGFASPVYFSKCFKDEYGNSPSDLAS